MKSDYLRAKKIILARQWDNQMPNWLRKNQKITLY